jgi:hypothetical protein
MLDVSRYRVVNLRKFVDANGGTKAVAMAVGLSNGSFISAIIGPKPSRRLSEAVARKYEEIFGLDAHYFDKPPTETAAIRVPLVAHCKCKTELREVVTLVGKACEAANLTLSPSKFADIVLLAMSNGRPDYIAALVNLAK